MAERHCPASGVDFRRVEAQLPRHGQGLRGKRLVQLEEVDVGDRQAPTLQRLSNRGDWSHTHDCGIDAGARERDHLRQRCAPELTRPLGAGDDERGRAVVDSRRIAGRDAAVLLEGRLQTGECLDGRACRGMLVGVEAGRLALLLRDLDGDDFA